MSPDTPAEVDQARREPMNQIEEANYIKLDGRVFSITPIANSEMNLEAELKQYYNEKYARHIDIFNNGVVSGLTNDWTAQLTRLQQRAREQSVTIPPALIGKYVICTDGAEVEQVKCIVYSPNVFKMVRRDIADALSITPQRTNDAQGRTITSYTTGKNIKFGSPVVTFDLNSVRDDTVLIVKVKQRIFFPAMYSFNARSNRLHCNNVNTFHSQSETICTGRNTASSFWRSDNFEELMNQTNCFSLGSRTVHLKQQGAREFGLSDFVKRTTILSVTPEGGGSTWRT